MADVKNTRRPNGYHADKNDDYAIALRETSYIFWYKREILMTFIYHISFPV